MADISITYRNGWALVSDVGTDKTAICIPSRDDGPPEVMKFQVVGWHESYEDAYHIVAAMAALDFTVADYTGQPAAQQVTEAIETAEATPQIEGPPKRKRRRPSSLLTLFTWGAL